MAINATKTIAVYDLDGSTEFLIPFEYLARKFVVVTLLGVDRQTLTINTNYRFVSPTLISLNVAQPVGYTQIELRRFTSATERLVDFHDGSILRAYDLNLSQVQTLHVAEEARDLAGDSIGVNDEGNLDARNRRVVNLANAIDDNDAVNYAMLKLYDASTYNNAQLAATSAAGALSSENKAKASEIRSKEAEATAVASANTSVQAATDAHNSKLAVEEAEAIVVPLVPVVEQASQDAAQAAADAAQAVLDVKDLGAVPVGTIVMFGHKAVPAGYIDLCVANPTFSVTEYPDLAKLYPTGVLPSYLNRYPKGFPINTVATLGAWMIPEHSHNFGVSTSATTSSFDYGTKSTNTTGNHTHNINRRGSNYASAFAPNHMKNWDYFNGGFETTLPNVYNGGALSNGVHATGNHAHNVVIGAHTHSITLNYNSVTAGIKQGMNKGSTLDVNHTGTTFAIKAAGKVSDEGLMEVTAIKSQLNALQTKVNSMHPIGSVVMRMDNINPKTIYGGTWTLITGDATVAFGGGGVMTGNVEGNNTPIVPVPAHTHSVTGTAASAGAHTHGYRAYMASTTITTVGAYNNSWAPTTQQTSSAGAHTHSVTGTAASAGTANAKIDVRGARIKINIWQRTA